MGVLTWIVFGFLAGFLAKWILPGRDPGGIIVTILIGILGAVTAGYLGGLAGLPIPVGEFSIYGLVSAVVGAGILLVVWKAIIGSRV